MSTRSSRPSSTKSTKSGRGKQDAVEAPQEESPQPAVPKSWDDLLFVEQCLERRSTSTHSEFESFLAEALHLNKFRVDLRESVVLDFYTYNIEYAANASFDSAKTSALLVMMEQMRHMIVKIEENEVDESINHVLQFMKQELVKHCGKREMQVEKKPPEPSPEELAAMKKKKKKGSAKGKGTEEEEPVVVQYEIVIMPALYTLDDAKSISSFVLRTLAQHWRLYGYVFNESQARSLSKYSAFLEHPMAPPPLYSAMPEEEWVEKKEKERLEREEHERKEHEQEEARRRAEQEEERLRLQREEEERNAPKLSRDDLQEVATFLTYHITRDVDTKKSELVDKITELQEKLSTLAKNPKK